MKKFAFAFYLTHWKEDLLWPFKICLKSLRLNGGEAQHYPRYLIFSGEVTDQVESFCHQHSLELILRPRWTRDFALPNRTLVCSAPAHDVVCLLDTDIVFLNSPTPIFQEALETSSAMSRIDISWPYSPLARRLHLTRLARWIWQRQFSRFASSKCLPELVEHPTQGKIPPYFNGGVHFVPGRYLAQLGTRWQSICSTLYRDSRWRRPYTFLFQSYYFEMMSFALALHAEGVPWKAMSHRYNLMPVPYAPRADYAVDQESVILLHLVKEMRGWLDPDYCERPADFQHLWNRVRNILAE